MVFVSGEVPCSTDRSTSGTWLGTSATTVRDVANTLSFVGSPVTFFSISGAGGACALAVFINPRTRVLGTNGLRTLLLRLLNFLASLDIADFVIIAVLVNSAHACTVYGGVDQEL